MRIKLFSFKPFELPEFELANNKHGHILEFTEENLNIHTAKQVRNLEAVSVFSNDDASETVLSALSERGVRYLALRSAGYNHVDLEAAKRVGIKVANVPAYSPHAIAEHAIALLLAVNRKLKQAQLRVAMHDYTLDGLTGFDLNGKVAGIVGTGHIGAIVARILKAFGCKILAYDIHPDESLAKEVTYVSLEQLCAQSDVISLHVPQNKHTQYMIDEKMLALMKPGVLIVNTARGGIIHTPSLINALIRGHVSGYGMDVYERESGIFFYNHSHHVINDKELLTLHAMNNVVITAHQAFLTREALHGIAETTLDNITQWQNNQTCVNEINPNQS
jgi:D-lactate dehydrogenase